MAGHPDAARTALDAAREGVANPRGHLHTLGIAWPLIWLEEFDEARRFVTWAVQVQREGGYHSFLPQSLLPEAELDFRTGHWDRALAGALEAEQLFAETNQLVDVAIAASTLARIEARAATPRQLPSTLRRRSVATARPACSPPPRSVSRRSATSSSRDVSSTVPSTISRGRRASPPAAKYRRWVCSKWNPT